MTNQRHHWLLLFVPNKLKSTPPKHAQTTFLYDPAFRPKSKLNHPLQKQRYSCRMDRKKNEFLAPPNLLPFLIKIKIIPKTFLFDQTKRKVHECSKLFFSNTLLARTKTGSKSTRYFISVNRSNIQPIQSFGVKTLLGVFLSKFEVFIFGSKNRGKEISLKKKKNWIFLLLMSCPIDMKIKTSIICCSRWDVHIIIFCSSCLFVEHEFLFCVSTYFHRGGKKKGPLSFLFKKKVKNSTKHSQNVLSKWMFKTFLLKHLVITNQKRNQIYKIIHPSKTVRKRPSSSIFSLKIQKHCNDWIWEKNNLHHYYSVWGEAKKLAMDSIMFSVPVKRSSWRSNCEAHSHYFATIKNIAII